MDPFGDLVEATLQVHLGNGVFTDVSPEVLHLLDGEEGLGIFPVGSVGTGTDIFLQLLAPIVDCGMLSLQDLSSMGSLSNTL